MPVIILLNSTKHLVTLFTAHFSATHKVSHVVEDFRATRSRLSNMDPGTVYVLTNCDMKPHRYEIYCLAKKNEAGYCVVSDEVLSKAKHDNPCFVVGDYGVCEGDLMESKAISEVDGIYDKAMIEKDGIDNKAMMEKDDVVSDMEGNTTKQHFARDDTLFKNDRYHVDRRYAVRYHKDANHPYSKLLHSISTALRTPLHCSTAHKKTLVGPNYLADVSAALKAVNKVFETNTAVETSTLVETYCAIFRECEKRIFRMIGVNPLGIEEVIECYRRMVNEELIRRGRSSKM